MLGLMFGKQFCSVSEPSDLPCVGGRWRFHSLVWCYTDGISPLHCWDVLWVACGLQWV